MDVDELDDDLLELYCNRESEWITDVPYISTNYEKMQWKLGPIFKEREIHDYDTAFKAYISEASGVCIATQIKGPNPGVQGVAKIRMQYVFREVGQPCFC